jgi:hypothetical protein
MKKYLLSLEIWSNKLTLMQLTESLGCEPAESSHTIGQIRFNEQVWEESAWKKEIGTFQDKDFDEALREVCNLCDDLSKGFSRLMSLSNEVEIVLNIGIIADTGSIGATLSSTLLAKLSEYPISVSFNAYPVGLPVTGS